MRPWGRQQPSHGKASSRSLFAIGGRNAAGPQPETNVSWRGDYSMTVDQARHILKTDQVAQQLLGSPSIARLAYTWRDGSPRVVPMWFQWTGEDLLMGAPPNSPKMKVLSVRPQVAVSIDT